MLKAINLAVLTGVLGLWVYERVEAYLDARAYRKAMLEQEGAPPQIPSIERTTDEGVWHTSIAEQIQKVVSLKQNAGVAGRFIGGGGLAVIPSLAAARSTLEGKAAAYHAVRRGNSEELFNAQVDLLVAALDYAECKAPGAAANSRRTPWSFWWGALPPPVVGGMVPPPGTAVRDLLGVKPPASDPEGQRRLAAAMVAQGRAARRVATT